MRCHVSLLVGVVTPTVKGKGRGWARPEPLCCCELTAAKRGDKSALVYFMLCFCHALRVGVDMEEEGFSHGLYFLHVCLRCIMHVHYIATIASAPEC